jgi:hypothetical protein
VVAFVYVREDFLDLGKRALRPANSHAR